MKLSPKVSVIIPTCNGRSSVFRAALSAVHQSVDELEVIVVDDNEVDSLKVLSNDLGFDFRIKIIRNSGDHGPSQARNYGVSHASGEFVTFLDDDDCFLPDRLRSLVDFFESSRDKYSFISSGRFAEVDDFSEIELLHGQKFGKIRLNDIYHCNSIDIGFLMETDFFKRLGGFDESLTSLEDWDLIIRALKVRDGFKIQRLDYAVNRSKGRSRVSEREAKGYFDISDKYASYFGKRWTFIPRAKGLCLAGELTFVKSVFYSWRSRSLQPIKFYFSSRFPLFLTLVKKSLGR